MRNPFDLIRKMFPRFVGASSAAAGIEMKQVFGPDRTFSIMVPVHWLDHSQTDRLAINAPGEGPSLAGVAWHMDKEVSLRQFADARFAGVEDMRIYSQVGKEYALAENGGLVREYQGRWPGDDKPTSYSVACFAAGSLHISVSLTTDRRDYLRNRALYRRMLSSLNVHGANSRIEGQDLSDDWSAKAANDALARRPVATDGKQPVLHCRILPGLPPYGDLAISFPKPNSFREGFVLEFTTSDGQKWVGNFAQGYQTWGPESGVYSELGEEAVFVVAQGAGYIINAKEKTLVQEVSDYISWIGYYAPIDAMIVCTDLDVHAYSKDGVLWQTERISWDGIEYVAIEGNSLTGKAYSPVDDGEHAFRIDLFSGAVDGGSYA